MAAACPDIQLAGRRRQRAQHARGLGPREVEGESPSIPGDLTRGRERVKRLCMHGKMVRGKEKIKVSTSTGNSTRGKEEIWISTSRGISPAGKRRYRSQHTRGIDPRKGEDKGLNFPGNLWDGTGTGALDLPKQTSIFGRWRIARGRG